MLIVVTSLEQTVVLPLQFSLDNIVLKQVSLHLTKISKQALVFLKLDFFLILMIRSHGSFFFMLWRKWAYVKSL